MKFLYYLLIIFLFPLCLTAQSYELEPFPFSFASPVDIASAEDGRLFIVEQRGRIIIINADGTKNETVFLDIVSKVNFGGERGLLGLALHPDFSENGLFYVNYTDTSDIHELRSLIS